ncbi:TRAP transporter large permease [Salirhabdus salicampi]|uniref:TRAP transporter large permease n=1 Tax=Salirhabdus salicampi TaxID=476102 RepID=UPI0020C2C820|nr:TRAP transporter large permease [Salirhabdus salicampi]
MILTLTTIFLILLLLGTPLFLAIVIPSLITTIFYYPNINITVTIQRMIDGIDSFPLLAIPFFMFAADVMSKGKTGERLVVLANRLVGHLPGGLAMATVVTCTLFGAISGTGPAAIVAVGGLLYPALLDNKYKDQFSLGVIISSSTLSMLIPPGVAMILYSIVSGTSVRDMFLAGTSVGLFVSILFMIYVFIHARRRNIPKKKRSSFKEVILAFKDAFWALGLPIVILGGIYLGYMTPTESAAIAVVYVIIIEVFIYKKLQFSDVYETAKTSGRMIAMIFILISAGSLLSWLLTTAQVPQTLASNLGDLSPITILLMINIIFIVTGMFLDPNSSIIILTPIVYPIAMASGADPIHLGLLIVLNASIGMLTPPFGMNIFVASGTFKVPYERIVPGLVPFIIISVIALILVTLIPDIALWLPNLVK